MVLYIADEVVSEASMLYSVKEVLLGEFTELAHTYVTTTEWRWPAQPFFSR